MRFSTMAIGRLGFAQKWLLWCERLVNVVAAMADPLGRIKSVEIECNNRCEIGKRRLFLQPALCWVTLHADDGWFP